MIRPQRYLFFSKKQNSASKTVKIFVICVSLLCKMLYKSSLRKRIYLRFYDFITSIIVFILLIFSFATAASSDFTLPRRTAI